MNQRAHPGAVFLYTDYTRLGPYVGHLHARLLQAVDPAPTVIDLMHDAPAFRADCAAYLLAANLPYLPADAVVLAVVDPGVGTERPGLILRAQERWLIGPDNGLLAVAAQDGADVEAYRLPPAPPGIPATFHGRDVFADAAAQVAATGRPPSGAERVDHWVGQKWLRDWDALIYTDGFGNLISGRRGASAPSHADVLIGGEALGQAEKFADVPEGTAFWYVNALGLVEVAVNSGSAAARLGAAPGTPLRWRPRGEPLLQSAPRPGS
ncbi:protein of unknown function DUF62 [Halorhodospira halophila SL1]|uniref:SAM-dependent chlorinase/fluorinase n=1 Tax=Halorhodospira halophila (strain DSM 244 / SL1) TaxID=349124 RepID=A1WV95_HALHL|nr:protein of unknown function DUF62 [Halorhodospira halophila SL1]MBK1729935.1 hypothetical protein [Halorhodospira halophila]